MTNIRKHLFYYFSLIGVLVISLVLILLLSPNRDLQMIVLIGAGISYVLVGIAHHLVNHDLVGKIVVEYVLIAVLGIAAVLFIFKGGFGL